MGPQIILGGTFTSVSPANDQSTVYSLPNTFAFDATTGAIDHTGFRPEVNGTVDTAIPGPRPHEVYIGGEFTTVDGSPMRVALLNTTTGKVVSSWKPPKINGTIGRLVTADGKLFVGGDFTTVGDQIHRGLVALNPTTGKATSYVKLSFTGHHNYGRQCDPSTQTCANGGPGVRSLDVNPAGTRMVAIGDFTTVSGQPRDQIAMIDLRKSTATLNPHWATLAYTAACFDDSFDSYIRSVQFSPDGSYFVVTASGGIGTNQDGTNSSCDAVARYETDGTGSNVRPTWIDYTGEDSLYTVAVTGSVVYVGGHERWLNNSLGANVAAPGAVARPGIAALNPDSGLPFSWNPGRNPRGAGCFSLLATSSGLWIGSDTNYIGNRTYLRQKVAFFPLAGGSDVPPEATPNLPGRVYLAGATAAGTPDPDRMAFREFDGTTTGNEIALSTGIPWGSMHGAFTVDGKVIYGGSDGNVYERDFDGTTFGQQVELDPYDDPRWDDVATGSGQTYQGQPSTFLSEVTSVTSMFFANGRLFYTLAGDAAIHWRWFEPESGVVGSDEFTISGGLDVSNVAGAFLAGQRLYYADQADGELWSVGWSGLGTTGAPRLVDASTDWASSGLFLLSNTSDPSPAPIAAFTAHCGHRPTCRFVATPWTDPDGGAVEYKWNFGDGDKSALAASTSRSHRFATNGTHHVTLTVVDTAGARSSSTQPVTVDAPVRRIGFAGASKVTGNRRSLQLRVPGSVIAGDVMLLYDSYASTSVRVTVPTGWQLVGKTHRHSLTTAVYERAARHPLPAVVKVRYSRVVRSSLMLAAYRHTAATPIERSVARPSMKAVTLRRLAVGTWVIGYWAQTSRRATSWQRPNRMHTRVAISGKHSALLADSGKPRFGTYQLEPARASKPARSATEWAVALAPALR